jgi:putative transposase
MLEPNLPEPPLITQAELLSLNRSGLYYHAVPPSVEEGAIKHRIDEIYTRWPLYGSRKIRVLLNQEEILVSRPTVQHYMREMGISGIAPGPNTNKSTPNHQVYPYLLRHLHPQRPNHAWGIDTLAPAVQAQVSPTSA